MIINCGNVNTLPYADKLKLVAGKNGIDRVIKWVHYMENPEYIDWLKGGELVLITGVLIKNNLSLLLNFIKDLNYKNVAGLVINIGPYIEKTPLEVIDMANSFDFPIFELPFQIRFIDISQSICKAIFMSKVEQESMNSFMKSIIYGNSSCSEEIVNRAIFYGYNPNKLYCTFVVQIDNFTQLIMKDRTWDEEIAFRLVQQISQIIIDVMSNHDKNIIHIVENNFIMIMMPISKIWRNKVNLIAKEIIDSINDKLKNIKVSIGIGGFWTKLDDLKYSVNKAQKALKIFKIIKSKNNICNYDDIGIYKLLFEIGKVEEMKIFYKEILGKLIDYDSKNSTALVETLEVYISQNCNLIDTANSLFIHKNTLKYRIRRIEEISNCSLKNMDNLLNFNMAFKIRNFMTCI